MAKNVTFCFLRVKDKLSFKILTDQSLKCFSTNVNILQCAEKYRKLHNAVKYVRITKKCLKGLYWANMLRNMSQHLNTDLLSTSSCCSHLFGAPGFAACLQFLSLSQELLYKPLEHIWTQRPVIAVSARDSTIHSHIGQTFEHKGFLQAVACQI